MSQDANCAGSPGDKSADDLIVTDGKLANVFVYVKGGPADRYSFDTPSEPVVLDQLGCRYQPRVLGIQTNQTFKVTNSDNTTHNVHPSPKTNQEWNNMQAQGAPAIEKKFPRAEIFRGQRQGRFLYNQERSAGKLHLGLLARDKRRADSTGHGRCEGVEDPGHHL
jgi:hypothetical protein